MVAGNGTMISAFYFSRQSTIKETSNDGKDFLEIIQSAVQKTLAENGVDTKTKAASKGLAGQRKNSVPNADRFGVTQERNTTHHSIYCPKPLC